MLESPPHPFSLKIFAPPRKVMCVCLYVCLCVCVVCGCTNKCGMVLVIANVQSSYYRCVIKSSVL